jgi:hypothetical protein
MLPAGTSVWLKIIGSVCAGSGSFLLAWRVKFLLKWVILTLVSHEITITEIQNIIIRKPQEFPMLNGTVKHLLNAEENPGVALLFVGFGLMGIGMFCTAASYFFN